MATTCYILGIVAYTIIIVYYAPSLWKRFTDWQRRWTNKQG
jgi:hypothetical protein